MSSKRFEVKRFLFETKDGNAVCRHMLTDCKIPMNVPNRYIEMKSTNKAGTGKSYAYKLCVFLNFLHESYHINYENAANKHVNGFLDFLIYGDRADFKINNMYVNLTYSTLSGYVSVITDFYRFLDRAYGSEMVFYESERKCRTQSYLYGQIYRYDYKYLIDRVLPDIKGSREYIKWYTKAEKESLCGNFNTLRDEAVFRLTLEGFRIDEVLSMRLLDYDENQRLIKPSRSKRRNTALPGFENKLRLVRISEKTANTINDYLFNERPGAENVGGTVRDEIFINLKGKNIGNPLSYHNYLKILKKCAQKSGIDKAKIRTHSGRSTKVMEVLEKNVQSPESAKSDLQIKYLFGWQSINSIEPYMNHNSEIMAKAAFDRHSKGSDDDE